MYLEAFYHYFSTWVCENETFPRSRLSEPEANSCVTVKKEYLLDFSWKSSGLFYFLAIKYNTSVGVDVEHGGVEHHQPPPAPLGGELGAAGELTPPAVLPPAIALYYLIREHSDKNRIMLGSRELECTLCCVMEIVLLSDISWCGKENTLIKLACNIHRIWNLHAFSWRIPPGFLLNPIRSWDDSPQGTKSETTNRLLIHSIGKNEVTHFYEVTFIQN